MILREWAEDDCPGVSRRFPRALSAFPGELRTSAAREITTSGRKNGLKLAISPKTH